MALLLAQLFDFGGEREQEEQVLQEYLGIVQSIDDPFSLFVKLDDITNLDIDYVYFFAYSIGKKRIILWGIYRKSTGEIMIDGGCRHTGGDQILALRRNWRTKNYEYAADTVMNRIKERIGRELGSKFVGSKQYRDAIGKNSLWEQLMGDLHRHPHIKSHADYLRFKYLLSYFDGKIDAAQLARLTRSEDTLENFYGDFELANNLTFGLSEDYDYLLLEHLADLREEVHYYEDGLNRNDINNLAVDKLSTRLATAASAGAAPNGPAASAGATSVEASVPVPMTLESAVSAVKHISDQFDEAIGKSRYNYISIMSRLPTCPTHIECLNDGVEGCQVYTYGEIDLHPDDPRSSSLM